MPPQTSLSDLLRATSCGKSMPIFVAIRGQALLKLGKQSHTYIEVLWMSCIGDKVWQVVLDVWLTLAHPVPTTATPTRSAASLRKSNADA